MKMLELEEPTVTAKVCNILILLSCVSFFLLHNRLLPSFFHFFYCHFLTRAHNLFYEVIHGKSTLTFDCLPLSLSISIFLSPHRRLSLTLTLLHSHSLCLTFCNSVSLCLFFPHPLTLLALTVSLSLSLSL